MSIGENLKRLRTEKELTQGTLAEKVNVSRSMITQIERGTKSMSIELAREISIALGCDVNDFYVNRQIARM